MRFIAPRREHVDAAVFDREPLRSWCSDHAEWLRGEAWPTIDELEAARRRAIARDGIERAAFVAQTPSLLADGLHYEQRIAQGGIATRAQNWHDLFNALAWLRHPRIKHALNRRQVGEMVHVGTRERSRAQCALTHFDEGGVVVLCADGDLLRLWDAHDWSGLFVGAHAAWGRRIGVLVFGHAILEHALRPAQLLVGKALAVQVDADLVAAVATGGSVAREHIDSMVGGWIARGEALLDPQELRPLPLSGIPGWDARAADPAFHVQAACFRPLRAGRRYPPPHRA